MRKFKTVCGLGLAAVSLLAGRAIADTITVESLTFDGPIGGGLYEWTYSANLSAFGEVETGDGFNITDISGADFIQASTPEWSFTVTPSSPLGAPDGTITATYIGSATVVGSQAPLVTVSFLDVFNTVSSSPAIWGSQDHALDGTAEAPVVDQLIATPGGTSNFPSVPMPASAVGGLVLFGLMCIPKAFKKIAM